jgi:hypothetical protein
MGVGLGADRIVFAPNFGVNQGAAVLVGALVLLLIVVFEGSILKAALRLAHRAKSKMTAAFPRSPRRCNAYGHPEGSELEVEFYGVADGISIVLSHGWGLHSRSGTT